MKILYGYEIMNKAEEDDNIKSIEITQDNDSIILTLEQVDKFCEDLQAVKKEIMDGE